MSIEVAGFTDGAARITGVSYVSPLEYIRTNDTVREAFDEFIHTYVGPQDGHSLAPVVERVCDGERLIYPQVMFTGYGGLGDVIHIRVNPASDDEPCGYFIACMNLHTATTEDVAIKRVDMFHDTHGGPQTVLYLDDERCDDWPEDYQPAVHIARFSQRFTYRPGFGQGESLLRPIEGLQAQIRMVDEAAQLQHAALARRTLTLIRDIPSPR